MVSHSSSVRSPRTSLLSAKTSVESHPRPLGNPLCQHGLGQNEAWRDRRSGLVWARLPPKDASGDQDFVVETFSFEENCAVLERALRSLLDFNPELSIVLTVSPVAAWATFFDDDVVTRSFGNKCLLRAVASRMTEIFPERIGYFPSFEIVLADNSDTFKADNRHVKYGTVNRIFAALTNASR
jgi:hypothetical protein